MKVGKAWKVVPTCIKDEATQREKTNLLAISLIFCLFVYLCTLFILAWEDRGGYTHRTLELKHYVRAHFCCFSITSCLCHKILLVSELPPSSPLLFFLPPFSSIIREIFLLYLPPTSPCLSYLVRNPSPTSYPPTLKRPSSYFPSLFITQQTNREE